VSKTSRETGGGVTAVQAMTLLVSEASRLNAAAAFCKLSSMLIMNILFVSFCISIHQIFIFKQSFCNWQPSAAFDHLTGVDFCK